MHIYATHSVTIKSLLCLLFLLLLKQLETFYKPLVINNNKEGIALRLTMV